jgi:superfamily II DNA or RNA helicase
MTFAVGSLVRVRDREWVVLPESDGELLVLRPLGGTDEEITGVYIPLETPTSASFAPPDPDQVGDFRSCRLLRDAVRLGFRSSAGPFRSFGRINVDPRPYQLVPLLMALRLDPVRLLIADDVGIGKTIEAGLIAREMLDRREIARLAVLCPPQLAEQWQRELAEKFHIEAELVLSSTVNRLERGRAMDESLFERFPFTVVSTDFIKADRRRDEFLRACPELVIVDEAHACVAAAEGRTARHQRYQLVRGLAARAGQHLLLVTATPHSGKDADFRALLTLLDPAFAELPEDLGGEANRRHRERVARHVVQRRRGDIEHYLATDTAFPKRADDREVAYTLDPAYRQLLHRALRYTRETVAEAGGPGHRQRVRWWSALALLRSLASSPVAAAATLRERARVADTETEEDANEVGRLAVLDLEVPEGEATDLAPGSEIGMHAGDESAHRRRLREMAQEVEQLAGEGDAKLQALIGEVRQLLREGHAPIVFCRFIPTAEYVAEHLRKALRDVTVEAVTGLLPPDDREARVERLGEAPRRVLVCTDCLSEGINLQEHFSAVVHYDLAWNPTRHEQREGRVDRFGQPRPIVQMVMIYGRDNGIDGIVLDVLLRKHRQIRRALGVSVPVPVDTNQVMEAILEGLLLRGRRPREGAEVEQLAFEEFQMPEQRALHQRWDSDVDRQRRSRALFAQHTIRVEEVDRELKDVRAAIGSGADVATFVREALAAEGAEVRGDSVLEVDLGRASPAVRDVLPVPEDRRTIRLGFEKPVPEDVTVLVRTHPFVEALAGHVVQAALDPMLGGVARRAGVIRTRRVRTRTTLLLVRFRYHLVSGAAEETPLLAEEGQLLGFEGAPTQPHWLALSEAEALLVATPDANVRDEQARGFMRQVIESLPALATRLDATARTRGEGLLEAHRRVRQSVRGRVRGLRVDPVLPPDVLGVYVLLPTPGA